MDRISTQVKLWWREHREPHPPLTAEELMHRMWAGMRLLGIVVLLLFVAVGVLEFQLQSRNRDISTLKSSVTRIETAATNIEDLATDTRDELRAAVEASGAPNPVIEKALAEIHQSLIILQNLEALVANTLEAQDDRPQDGVPG